MVKAGLVKMTLICLNCGEKERFSKKAYGTIHFEEVHRIDKEKNFIEFDEGDETDPQIDDHDPPECDECGEEVQDLAEKDYIETIWKHTKKDGSWSKSVLPENKRDDSIIYTAIAKKV